MTGQPARARDRGYKRDGAGDGAAPTSTPARRPGFELLRIFALAAAYAAASWLGHLTVFGDTGSTLFWPASGVALAWIATSARRTLPLELGLVGVLAAGAAYTTDQSTWAVLDALVGVPLGLAVFVAATRRWSPGLWATGGREQVVTLRQYGLLLAGAVLAGLTEAVVAVVVLLPDPGRPFGPTGELAITHTVAMATVGVTLLVVGGWFAGLPPDGRLAAIRSRVGRADLALGVLGIAVTVLVLLAGFAWLTDAPVSFVLVMAVVAIGVRYGAATTGLYALTVTGVVCWFTASGHGPIALIPEPHRRMLAFGLLAAALAATGLTISLSRRERDFTISRLQESERAAEVLADDLTLVLANLEEGVAVVEKGGRFIHANAAIGRLLQMPDFDDTRVAPVETYRLAHLDGRPLLESEVPHVRAFAGEEDVHDTLRLVRPDQPHDRIFEVSSRLLPQIRSTDKPRAVTMIRDVTSEHEHRDALASFAQVVAHDLRSPLTSVELWARELLESYAQGPVTRETGAMMAGHIDAAARRMQNFISDLLGYALARDQTPSPVPVELTDILESVVETIAAVEGASPDVTFADLPQVWVDPVLVPQLFDNLIGNSRKYVAEGVVPRVRVEATETADDWALVRVIDNGIGIAPEDRTRVFESFERARGAEYEGTGLGLSICRHIVERHGGSIAVTTPPEGFGTCIELSLPMTDEAFDRATSGWAKDR